MVLHAHPYGILKNSLYEFILSRKVFIYQNINWFNKVTKGTTRALKSHLRFCN